MQPRKREFRETLRKIEPRPKSIRLGMREEGIEPRHRPTDGFVHITEWKPHERDVHVGCLHAFGLRGVARDPARDERKPHRATEVEVAIEAAPRRLRRDGREPGRIFRRRLPLHRADIRAAHHPHAPAAPRLPRDPLDGVVAVLPLVVVRRPHPLRPARAAAILDHRDIARLRKLLRRALRLRPIIRRAHQHHRRLAHRVVAINVRGELDAIAHRHRDGFDANLCCGRDTESDGCEQTDECFHDLL